jgi:hypothetical protein
VEMEMDEFGMAGHRGRISDANGCLSRRERRSCSPAAVDER